MNTTATLKTHLDAEFPTCSFHFLGAEASQGWLLKAWEKGRQGETVGEAGSLCSAHAAAEA